MKKLARLLLIGPIAILIISTISITSVYAEHSENGGSGDSSSTTSGSSDTSTENSTGGSQGSGGSEVGTSGDGNSTSGNSSTKSPGTHDGSLASSEDNAETEAEMTFRQEGEQILSNAKEAHHSHRSAAVIAKACQASKHGIETRTAAITRNAQANLTRINNVFSEVIAFQKSSNQRIANFDALVAAATSAQTKATTSVQALIALNPTIDCTNTSVAAEVATFQAALGQARADLIAYRTAVEDLLTAVENAS